MAGLPTIETLREHGFKFASGAPKRRIEQFASPAFVARKENAVFLGRSGVRKTRLDITMGRKAANAGIKTRFTTAADLIPKTEAAWRQSRLSDVLETMSRVSLPPPQARRRSDKWGLHTARHTQHSGGSRFNQHAGALSNRR